MLLKKRLDNGIIVGTYLTDNGVFKENCFFSTLLRILNTINMVYLNSQYSQFLKWPMPYFACLFGC